jgi:hypothetical protein
VRKMTVLSYPDRDRPVNAILTIRTRMIEGAAPTLARTKPIRYRTKNRRGHRNQKSGMRRILRGGPPVHHQAGILVPRITSAGSGRDPE